MPLPFSSAGRPSTRALRVLSRTLLAWGLWQVALLAQAAQLPVDRLTQSPALEGQVTRSVQVSPDGQRVSFLRGRDDDQHRMDLWVYERSTGQARRLIDSTQLGPDQALSAAERDRREREHTAKLSGIVNHEWAPDGQQLLFALGDALYLARLQPGGGVSIRAVAQGDGLIDAHMSPKGRYLSYLQGQNLQVLDLRTGRRQALTRDGGGPIHNAESEFVAQEEMDQNRGYWWAPDESAIAFKRFDESVVPVQRRFEIHAQRTEVVEQRYPVAGGPNVRVRLGVVRPIGGAVRWLDLGPQPDIYLPRVDWLPDSRRLSYQVQSRDQRHLTLWQVDLRTGQHKALAEEHAKTWVGLHSDLHFLQRRPAFIWAGDREGRKHLELVPLDGGARIALTAGDWQVDQLLAVDEVGGWVYLAGDTGDSTQRQVYRVGLDGRHSRAPERVSTGTGWHEPVFATQADRVDLWVDTFSNPDTPPQTRILGPQGEHLAWISENRLDAQHPYAPYLDHHVRPEFGQLTADDGQVLNYSLTKPPGFDPKLRYPVLLAIYGGPLAQEVTQRWGRLFEQVMAQRGVLVFSLDNRGSDRRGRRFADAIHQRLGDVEVRDQLRGLDWLKSQSWVDSRRIGVYGWSYGGYMTLMLLSTAPAGTFAGGVAGAPVTRFELYDTHYTERYLSTPQSNPAGYAATSVFSHLDGLTSPLLLIHGMADDNVLFTNSTELMAALQARGRPFRLMTYPGAKHGLSTPEMARHRDRLVADTLDEWLRPDTRMPAGDTPR